MVLFYFPSFQTNGRNSLLTNSKVVQSPQIGKNSTIIQRNKAFSVTNQPFKVRGVINISLSLQEPYNLTINSNFYMEISTKPTNYSLELDSVNYSFIDNNNNFTYCLIESENIIDGIYEIFFFIELNYTIWEKYETSFIIDNTAPQISEIEFPWNSIQPDTQTNLTIQVYDLMNITRVNLTVFQLSTHIVIVSKVFYSPLSNQSLVISIPRLPFGFHGYFKVFTEDELGNEGVLGSYNFKVRSIDINNFVLRDPVYGREHSIGNRTYTLFRSLNYYLEFNLTNFLLDNEEEIYFISLRFANDYNETWYLDFDSDRTKLSLPLHPEYNGTCSSNFISVEWVHLSSNDQDNATRYLIFSTSFSVFILPPPSDFINFHNFFIISVFLIVGIIYRFHYRFYGSFKFKDSFTFPKHTKGLLLGLFFIVVFFLMGVLVYASLVSNGIIAIFLELFSAPTSLIFLLIITLFSMIIFSSAFILSRDVVDSVSEIIENKGIDNKFDNFLPPILFLIITISSFSILEKQNLQDLSFLFAKYFPSNTLFEHLQFLSLYYFLQFYVSRPMHRMLRKKKRIKENPLIESSIFFIGLVFYSTIHLWTYPFSNLFTVLVVIGFLAGFGIQIFINSVLLKSTSITPRNWHLFELEHHKVNPHRWNANIKYEIIHPRFVQVYATFFNEKELEITEISKNKSILDINRIIEFGVYRIELLIGFKVSFLSIGIRRKRIFEIKPYVEELNIRSFLNSIGYSKLERINNFDLDTSINIPGRRIFQITEVEKKFDQKFLRSLVYVSSETVSVNTIRDFDAILETEWVKKENLGLLITPTPLDVYSALQRTLYQTEDDVMIVPILYSDIVEHLHSESKHVQWKRIFDKAIRRYTSKQDLFSFTSPIDDPSQFFGRDGIITEIVNSCDLKQPFAILGFYRIGKSSVAREFARRYNTKAVVSIYRLSGTIGYQSLLGDIWWKLWNQLQEEKEGFDVPEKSYSEKNSLKSYRRLLSSFSKLQADNKNREKSRIIIIFDEMTKFMEADFSLAEKMKFLEFIRLLDEEFPFITIGIILHDDEVTNNTQFPTFQYFSEYWVTGLDHSEAQTMILDLAKRMEIRIPYSTAQRIVTHWDGYPLLIRFFCSMLYKRYGSDIPEISEKKFDSLLLDEDFSRKEDGSLRMIWENQICLIEQEILTKIINDDFIDLEEYNYQIHVKKLKIKGLIDDNLIIKSNSFQRWIKSNKIY